MPEQPYASRGRKDKPKAGTLIHYSTPEQPFSALYEQYKDGTVVDKCRVYARYTLPYLMVPYEQRNQNSQVVLENDFQSMGALLTNNLASKLARLLFPSQFPWFKIEFKRNILAAAIANGLEQQEINNNLARLETDSCQRLFRNASYNQLIMALKWLIATGNTAIYRDSTSNKCLSYGLESFVVRRDGLGNVMDAIVREPSFVCALPPDIQELLQKNAGGYRDDKAQCTIYTRIKRHERTESAVYTVQQQVDTTPIGDAIEYSEKLCPWLFPTWNLVIGEHYARGQVEDFAGDFAKLSELSAASTTYGVEMMRVLNLVDPSGIIDIDDAIQAQSGAYIRGAPGAITAYESGASQKLQQIVQAMQDVTTTLVRAFMYQANTRDAERVTKFEVQMQAEEAESALGGVYSSLAEHLQIPLAHILINEISKESSVSMLVGGIADVQILAGIPALGRSADIQNLLLAAQEIAAIVPVFMQLDKRFSPQKCIDMIFAGRSVDAELLFKSEEQLRAEQEQEAQELQATQQMQAVTAQAVGTEGINALAGGTQ